MEDLKNYVQINMNSFNVISISTNKVMEFSYKGTNYILRKQLLSEEQLSPFWQMMKDVFGSDFTKQRACVRSVYDLLNQNPHIKPATLILVDEEEEYQIFLKMSGKRWDPDNFPVSKDIAYQLGQFIGYNHSINIENYNLPGMNNGCLHKKLMNYMEAMISTHWNSDQVLDKKVRDYFEKLKTKTMQPNGYCLIMTDLSANQFLFEGNAITACVDLDAYVVGPKEWELALVRNCVEDYDSFKKGYEYYQALPDSEEMMGYYLFVMALGDIWGREEMQNFFTCLHEDSPE
jgi:hypothetical protein